MTETKFRLSDTFRAKQANGKTFRAQVIRGVDLFTLWIAENQEEIYVINYSKAVSADLYQSDSSDCLKVIILYADDEGDLECVDIGSFLQDDAVQFLSWFQEMQKIKI